MSLINFVTEKRSYSEILIHCTFTLVIFGGFLHLSISGFQLIGVNVLKWFCKPVLVWFLKYHSLFYLTVV